MMCKYFDQVPTYLFNNPTLVKLSMKIVSQVNVRHPVESTESTAKLNIDQ